MKLGRNDPCHCGSGKKYKHCHWQADRDAEAKALGEAAEERARAAAAAAEAEAEGGDAEGADGARNAGNPMKSGREGSTFLRGSGHNSGKGQTGGAAGRANRTTRGSQRGS